MELGRKILILIVSFHQCCSLLTQREVAFVVHLVERLSVLQCFFVSDTPVLSARATKLFSEHLLLTAYIDPNRLLSSDFPGNHLKSMLIMKMADVSVEDIFNGENENKKITNPIWLVLLDSYDDIMTLVIPYDCELYAAVDYATNITVYETYTLGNRTVIKYVGSWTSELGLIFPDKDYLVRRVDLQGITLRRQVFTQIIPGQMDLIYAQSEVVDGIQRIMNISFEIVSFEEAPDERFDVAEVPVVFSSFNEKNDEIVAPTINIVINMYIKKKLRSLEYYYIKPFEPLVWFTIFVWMMVASICLLAIFIWSKMKNPMMEWLEVILMPLDAICLQDGSGSSRVDTVRWVKILSRAIAGVIFPAYSAAIISYMTIRTPFVPFDDIRGLVESGKYKLGGQRNTFQVSFFNFSGAKYVKIAKEKYLLHGDNQPETLEDGIKMLCGSDHFVYMGYSGILPNMKTPCQILQIRQPITKSLVGFQMNPNITLIPAFIKLLLRFYSNGIVNRRQRLLDSRITPDDDLVAPGDEEYLAVSIDLVSDIFAILLVGIVLASLLLCTEHIIHNFYYWRPAFNLKVRKQVKRKKRALFLSHIQI